MDTKMLPPDVRCLVVLMLALTLEHRVTSNVMATSDYDVTGLKRSSEETFVVPMKDKEQFKHVATIIDSLEKLGILDASRQFCYTLDKIVKGMVVDKQMKAWKVDLSLHVREIGRKRLKGNDNIVTSNPDGDGDMTSSGSNDVAGANEVEEKCIMHIAKPSGSVDNRNNGELNVITDNASELYEVDSKGNNGTNNVSSVAMIGEDDVPKHGSKFNITGGKSNNEPYIGRLSKTQVLVIATCTSVVGVFFIVAVILRVNNYIKRKREEQAAARRPSYRSTSFGLRSNSQSQQGEPNNAKDGKLEAALNKGSSETAAMVTGRKDDDDDGDVTPKLSNQETRPLLIVTAASAPSSPCLPRNRTEYQYSNNDDEETMMADENHDQKAANKSAAKPKDISNRRRPKQRRSNNGYTRVDGPASDTSLREEDEDEDQDDSDDDVSNIPSSGISRTPRGQGNGETTGETISSDLGAKFKPNGVLHGVNDQSKGVDHRVRKTDNNQADMISWIEKDSSKTEESVQRHAPNADKEESEELEEVVTHELESYLSSIPEQSDMDGVGFTQSDSSLSSTSTNPSYRYGNQVEYTGVQQYPNVVYCPEYYEETVGTVPIEPMPPPPTEAEYRQRQRQRMGDLPKVPFKTFESFDQGPISVERQVSVDSLTYNESPPMRRQLSSSLQGTSVDEQQEKEKQDFWLEEEADEDVTSPTGDSSRFAFPNERFAYRDDRLPNIQEDESCDSGNLRKRGSGVGGGSGRDRRFRNSGKTGVLTRQKNTVQDDAESPLTGASSKGDSQMRQGSRGPHCLPNGEMENESSESDSGEVASSSLLSTNHTRPRKKRNQKPNQSSNWSILEDPDFEGMEPTYV